MTDEPTMPADVTLVRRTAEFTDQSVPPALRRSHQIASDVWGRLRVVAGTVVFVFERDEAIAHTLSAGAHIDIPPSTPHHVEPRPGSRFYIEFHR